MMTSTNYDDSKERNTGGVNGVGIKAVNIFSKKFILETQYFNPVSKKLFYFK